MTENTQESINLEINQDLYFYNTDYTILQACEKIGIYIPKFCYHDKLKIAGNCRVCLVEEIKSNKPIISCATLINTGNEIYTQTQMALDSRESIIEYLLINHPLDCPICDQGGERDLQDQTVAYGSDLGRYYEYKKRSVENKNYTPLIKFFLNRCIHCARCTRFSHDVSSSFLFSLLGRGGNSEISSYTKSLFLDELSGNVIDLCPVGALTSKPYAFVSRVWELVDFKSIDIFDSLNSLIKIECRGLQIMRVLPLLNDFINIEWISDKIRFNYDSYQKQRILNCIFVINNRFYYYS
jgi:NADH dehydrogenase (ubiquinone) Fe-S protein 1